MIIRCSLCGQLAAFGWGWHETGETPVLICRPCVDVDPEIAKRVAPQRALSRIVDVDTEITHRERDST